MLRKFGFIVGGVFTVIAFLPVIFHGRPFRLWALIVAGCLIVPAAVWPPLLGPVFKFWMKVGHVLGVINNRIILGFVFYVILAPLGHLMKLMNKDPLDKKFDPTQTSYRVRREARESRHMNKQF